jgi:hypothetical protein
VSDIEEPPILKCAFLKKLKTVKSSHQYKKKFFVLLGIQIQTILSFFIFFFYLD